MMAMAQISCRGPQFPLIIRDFTVQYEQMDAYVNKFLNVLQTLTIY
jgi:hypothetical protein